MKEIKIYLTDFNSKIYILIILSINLLLMLEDTSLKISEWKSESQDLRKFKKIYFKSLYYMFKIY